MLNKPFAEVAQAIELGYPFTQRGMRRTFNDLARAAEVESLVTRSISGYLTERMQHHYSTVMTVRESRGDESSAKANDNASAGKPVSEPSGAPRIGVVLKRKNRL